MYSLRAQDLLQQQPESHRRHNMGYLAREHRHVSLLPPDFSKTPHPSDLVVRLTSLTHLSSLTDLTAHPLTPFKPNRALRRYLLRLHALCRIHLPSPSPFLRSLQERLPLPPPEFQTKQLLALTLRIRSHCGEVER